MPNKNTHYKVKNLHGTSKDRYSKKKCECDNWLAHWRNNTKSQRTTCAVLECARKATVGAHVICVDGRMSNEWYIVPFCKYHNHYEKKDEYFLDSRVHLIPVYKLDGCKRG
ncbi:hypothetical protein PN36_19965 [Candidatus Thiomargarita nelsonii]|uniref:Uncharacterized protein n=1 Tax=Candidatus Thiomargarita nelsonii TaxID=1003181 RepID=A0A0A6P6J5_9GAMM|nr:hypothetical protein PN36_19965 [Candidatus Thiomargarita nelsonii]